MAIVFNNLSSGGGSKLYKHIIKTTLQNEETTFNEDLLLEIINSSNEKFTLETFCEYFDKIEIDQYTSNIIADFKVISYSTQFLFGYFQLGNFGAKQYTVKIQSINGTNSLIGTNGTITIGSSFAASGKFTALQDFVTPL